MGDGDVMDMPSGKSRLVTGVTGTAGNVVTKLSICPSSGVHESVVWTLKTVVVEAGPV